MQSARKLTRARAASRLGLVGGATLALAAVCAVCAGCAGGAPLLHPAHVLRPGLVTAGAGVVARAALGGGEGEATAARLQELAVAPGVSPVVAARVGVAGDNEAGLTYAGRAIRVDGRHAFDLGKLTLSAGGGVSALIAERPRDDGSSSYGLGLDVPVLLGWSSSNDIYSVWIGPRGGLSLVRGRAARASGAPPGAAEDAFDEVSILHGFGGAVIGVRVGFRHLHAALELEADFHGLGGEIGAERRSLTQATLTPSGALIATF